MSARARRRRRPATRRRARRWLRRQDRFTRTLLVAAGLLAALVIALMLPRLGEQRLGSGGIAPAKPPEFAARRAVSGSSATAPAGARRPLRQPSPPTLPAPPQPSRIVAPEHAAAPRLAIVIDDLGQSFSHFQQVAELAIPLSIAVIPGLPATARTVREAARRRIEILLHQPMEPHEEGGKNPGNGALLTSMSPEAIRERVRDSLAAVPGTVGVNNHMGSRFTEDAAGVGALMAELREQKLFWLDSRTTAATLGTAVAQSVGVPAIERDVFIDAEVNVDFIRGQLRRLVETARLRGTAVGIGHPHPETLAVLRQMHGELLESGVTLVPVSALVRAAPTAERAATLLSSVPQPGPGRPASESRTATP